MKKLSRILPAISFILVLALFFAACNSGSANSPTPTPTQSSDTSDNTEDEGEQAEATPAPDPYAPMPEMVTFHIGAAVQAEPKYPEGESIEKNDVLKWYQDNMNIDLKYDWVISNQGTSFKDKINLLIASNELPDFFTLDTSHMNMVKKMIQSDMIMDVTDIYNDYASPTFKEMHSAADNIAFKAVTFDGKLMAIPGLSDTETAAAIMWYRADWLEQAGLQPPVTADDVFNIVKVLKEKGLASYGALPARADKELFEGDTASFEWIFSYYNAYPGMWIPGPDGKVTYGSIQPEAKEALAKLREKYQEGLLPSDFALLDGNKATELVSGNQVGIFMGAWWSTWWPLSDSLKNDPTAVWKGTILKSEDGKYYQKGWSPTKNFTLIKKGVEHPEAVMKLINIAEDCSLKKNDWYNALVNDDGAKYKAVPGATMPTLPLAKYLDEISRKYNAIMDVIANPDNASKYDAETAVLAGNVKAEAENPLADINNWTIATSWTEGVGAFAGKGMIQMIPAFDSTTDTYTKNRSILIDLEKSTFLKIIMGEVPLDDFDKFVTDWLALGGEQILKEINEIVSN